MGPSCWEATSPPTKVEVERGIGRGPSTPQDAVAAVSGYLFSSQHGVLPLNCIWSLPKLTVSLIHPWICAGRGFSIKHKEGPWGGEDPGGSSFALAHPPKVWSWQRRDAQEEGASNSRAMSPGPPRDSADRCLHQNHLCINTHKTPSLQSPATKM